MSSTTLSRRRVLAAGGSCLSTAVAGCSGSGGSTSDSETVHDTNRVSESTHEYDVLFVRSADNAQFIYPDDAAAQQEDDEDRPLRHDHLFFVIDDDDADTLRIASNGNAVEATEIREFVADTDFETESIVVNQRPIGDCYHRQVLGVQAMDDDLSLQYCRTLKDPMTPCEADTDVMQAVVFRVHRPYEEAPSSRSRSESASCRGSIIVAGNGFETNTSGNGSADTGATDSEEGNRE
ncbi:MULTISPECIES: hypothetical protein [unclassified Natrinema]|uniref:hypothetical protein n=1 Tax=unclassified Natrinema TaxID=2622230 RepID=UPI0011AE3E5E|nr:MULTISPECIES: hypothetical protein [unclassified Natrinema]